MRNWIGRVNAEMQDGKDCWFITLTYGGGYENPKAYWLDYKDVQDTFKRLRKAKFRFRYFIVGEYGSQKDRAHWHALIFWETKPPLAVFNTEHDWPFWPHGHSYIETPRSRTATAIYICKYLLKDDTAPMRFSTKPALGEGYLGRYAERLARQGLPLFKDGPRYTVPNNNAKDGKPFYYYLDRHSGVYERMLARYISTWITCRPNQKLPLTKAMETEYFEYFGNTEQPRYVEDYLRRVYDYEANVPKHPLKVVTLANGWQIVQYNTATIVEKRDHKGDVLWEAMLESADAASSVARALALQKIQSAPPRLRRVRYVKPKQENMKKLGLL